MAENSLKRIGLVMLIFMLVILSCSLPVNTVDNSSSDSNRVNIEETQAALAIKATRLANKEATQLAQDQEAEAQPSATDPPPPTPEALPTYTPYPTYTIAPVAVVPQVINTLEVAPPPTQDTGQDIQARIKAANILVYEDIRGYPALLPRVQQAIKSMDFSGGQVVMVGDAVGDFMTQLNSPTRWDLIIVASEVRTGVRGEFWDLILKQAQKKVGLAIEVWYVDKDYYDKLNFLLEECGVTLQKNWTRPVNFQPLNYSIYWLQQDNPLFTIYKTVPPLVTPNIYWAGDAGDLMKVSGTGDAQLLAGIQPSEASSYGVLTSCMQGRMILQTFSSHDYQETKTVALWENYIVYTLTNHFNTAK
jgi:hypothetical protein